MKYMEAMRYAVKRYAAGEYSKIRSEKMDEGCYLFISNNGFYKTKKDGDIVPYHPHIDDFYLEWFPYVENKYSIVASFEIEDGYIFDTFQKSSLQEIIDDDKIGLQNYLYELFFDIIQERDPKISVINKETKVEEFSF